MAIAFTLVESTPNRLRYLCTNSGETIFPSSGTLDNATLQADAIDGTQMATVMAKTVATQAKARELLLGDGPASLEDAEDIDVARCHCKLTPRNLVALTTVQWAVDANADGSNLPEIIVYGTDSAGPSYAYLDIEFAHTFTR
jgi:hypothetical protein